MFAPEAVFYASLQQGLLRFFIEGLKIEMISRKTKLINADCTKQSLKYFSKSPSFTFQDLLVKNTHKRRDSDKYPGVDNIFIMLL